METVTGEKSTTFKSAPVLLTERALKELKRLITAENIPAEKGLRVGVKNGGCSGMSYVLEFDEKVDGDEEYNIDDVHVLLNKAHELYLYGMQIDYENGLNARGFVFINPNAKTTCGCGTSFSA